MQISQSFIVLRRKKDGEFLVEFESKPTSFAYRAGFTNRIEDAATMPLDIYLEQKDKIKSLAKAFNAEIVKVESTYNLTYPNGSDVKEIKNEKIDNPLRELFESFKAAKEREGIN